MKEPEDGWETDWNKFVEWADKRQISEELRAEFWECWKIAWWLGKEN